MPLRSNGVYRDPKTGYFSDANGGLANNYDSGLGDNVDDFPLDDDGRPRIYDGYNRTVRGLAQAGQDLGDAAAGAIPLYNAYTAITGKTASGRKASTADRIGAGLSLVPGSAWGAVGSVVSKPFRVHGQAALPTLMKAAKPDQVYTSANGLLKFPVRKLQHEATHAKDFGVMILDPSKTTKADWLAFQAALEQHVRSATV